MKKEIVALVLLAALIAGGLYNTHHLGVFTGDLNETLSLSRVYCENGEYAMALEQANKASDEWHDHESYSAIFLRHTEIDAVSDLFYELIGALKSSEPDSARAVYDPLTAHIRSLYDMERPNLGSIF